MTSRERVIRTLQFDRPDRAPRELWVLPGVPQQRGAELASLLAQFSMDFAEPVARYGASARAAGTPNAVGEYTDPWGCVWSVAEDGVVGEVTRAPLEEWGQLEAFQAPYELLDGADFSQTNAACAATDRFVRAGTGIRPFERMQFLRGTENLLLDLAVLPDELFRLRDLVHAYFLREMAMWAQTDVDGVSFMDDWGAQHSLLIAPALWREFYKPCYKAYCDIARSHGKYVFFHSDGFIEPIYEDLIEIGVHAVNSQLFCMDIEGIAARHKGKITFWGEIDRQHVLPFGSVEEVRDAVRRVRAAFDDGAGGVIAQCEWGLRDPKENIVAVFETWLK
jgi:uroporphyrinogen decarboxylase